MKINANSTYRANRSIQEFEDLKVRHEIMARDTTGKHMHCPDGMLQVSRIARILNGVEYVEDVEVLIRCSQWLYEHLRELTGNCSESEDVELMETERLGLECTNVARDIGYVTAYIEQLGNEIKGLNNEIKELNSVNVVEERIEMAKRIEELQAHREEAEKRRKKLETLAIRCQKCERSAAAANRQRSRTIGPLEERIRTVHRCLAALIDAKFRNSILQPGTLAAIAERDRVSAQPIVEYIGYIKEQVDRLRTLINEQRNNMTTSDIVKIIKQQLWYTQELLFWTETLANMATRNNVSRNHSDSLEEGEELKWWTTAYLETRVDVGYRMTGDKNRRTVAGRDCVDFLS